MNDLWLKVKIWTKGIIFGIILLYLLFFIIKNDESAKVWFWFGQEAQTPLLVLLFMTFLLGVLATILTRTTIKTIQQFRELKARNRTDRLEREVADMKSKASRLQTRPEQSPPQPGI
jgi:uncharacterized integral membrane protein